MPANKNPDIDIGLSVMCAVVPAPITFNVTEIADVCGCTHQNIDKITKSAFKKIRQNKTLHAYAKDLINEH